MPGFIRKSVPVSVAADTIERAIERRSGRALGAPLRRRRARAPRHHPAADRAARDAQPRSCAEALRLADPANGGLDGQDPLLGVAASAEPDQRL